MRIAIILCSLVLAGCIDPAQDVDVGPGPPGTLPEHWYPAEGVEWDNLTGEIPAGSCTSMPARHSPPSIAAWWLRAAPNATLLVRNWTESSSRVHLGLCFDRANLTLHSRHNISQTAGSVELAAGHPGFEFAIGCDASVPCNVHFWTQRIQRVTDANGTSRWAGEIGPPGAAYFS